MAIDKEQATAFSVALSKSLIERRKIVLVAPRDELDSLSELAALNGLLFSPRAELDLEYERGQDVIAKFAASKASRELVRQQEERQQRALDFKADQEARATNFTANRANLVEVLGHKQSNHPERKIGTEQPKKDCFEVRSDESDRHVQDRSGLHERNDRVLWGFGLGALSLLLHGDVGFAVVIMVAGIIAAYSGLF
jgi:hypothetical protein